MCYHQSAKLSEELGFVSLEGVKEFGWNCSFWVTVSKGRVGGLCVGRGCSCRGRREGGREVRNFAFGLDVDDGKVVGERYGGEV